MFTSYTQNLRICFIAEVIFLGVLRTTQGEHYSGSSGRLLHSNKCPMRESGGRSMMEKRGIEAEAESGDSRPCLKVKARTASHETQTQDVGEPRVPTDNPAFSSGSHFSFLTYRNSTDHCSLYYLDPKVCSNKWRSDRKWIIPLRGVYMRSVFNSTL